MGGGTIDLVIIVASLWRFGEVETLELRLMLVPSYFFERIEFLMLYILVLVLALRMLLNSPFRSLTALTLA